MTMNPQYFLAEMYEAHDGYSVRPHVVTPKPATI